MKKESFVLYTKYIEQIELLSMEQRGVLFTAIMNFEAGLELPDMDGMTKMAFAFIKGQLEFDDKKYAETVQKRSEAGKQGGRPPKANESFDKSEKQEKAKKANAFSEKQKKQEKAKKADNEYVYDSDYDNEYDSVYSNTNNYLLTYDKVLNIAKEECPTCYNRYQKKIDSGKLEYANKLTQILDDLQGQYDYEAIRQLFRHANKTYITSPNYQSLDLIWVLSNIERVKAIEERDGDTSNDKPQCQNNYQQAPKQVTSKTAEELQAIFGLVSPEDI